MSVPVPETSPFQRILFCTDFSENADYAFDFAIDAARRRPGSTLYLLHVNPEPDAQFWQGYVSQVEDVEDKARQDIQQKLAEAYLPRVPEGVALQVEIRTGRDYIRILEFAREKDVDLIIMGRHGRSSLEKMLFGNVTEKVARKAECAVLIIPLSFQARHRGSGQG
jgi:nucleotide-binding universal stress UspA family protein